VGDLELLRDGKTYQLWGIAGGNPVSLRVIGKNPDFETFTVPPTVTMLFMTVEDEGGVVTSAMAPVVSGSVNSLGFDGASEDRIPNGSLRSRVV
jgi:anti-sigma-K factor RskA